MKHTLTKTRSGAHVLFDNDRFTVTSADIMTPHAYYPVLATTGRIKRDILWCALAYSAVSGLMLFAYADLWRIGEMALMAGSIALALYIGKSFSILQIDARGFPARFFIARTRTIRSLFEAISEARALGGSSGGGFEADQLEDAAD